MKRKLFILTILIAVFFAFSPSVFAEDWCHTFTITMQKGDSGDEVSALQTALMKEGILDIEQPTGYFWTLTFNAVVAFQEKYASEILTPLGLSQGTGKVASATRAKLNQLYGCSTDVVCTQDVKQCSDGSYVSRVAPNCNFAVCPTVACTPSWQLGQWGVCVNGQQARTVTDFNNCGAQPALSMLVQSCVSASPCQESNWTFSLSPSTCPSSGSQTKVWSIIGACTGGLTHPSTETVTCNYQTPICTSWTYSSWSVCDSSGVKTRAVILSSPFGCAGGNPVTSETCTYIPPCEESNWTFSLSPSTCPSSGSQTKTWTKIGTCGGGLTHPSTETVTCTTVDIKANSSDGPLIFSNNTPVALTWTSKYATSCIASGSWSGTKNISGSESTAKLTAPQAYTITCTGSGGTATDSVFVNPTTAFVVDIKANSSDGPLTIPNNSSATLTWTSSNATYCTISHIPCSTCGNAGPSTPVPVNLSGSQLTEALLYTSSQTSRTYTITCYGSSGSVSDSVVINISLEPYWPTVIIKANGIESPVFGASQRIPLTAQVALSWESTNATSCTAGGDWSGSKPLVGYEVRTTPSGKDSAVYYLNCAGPGGEKLGSVQLGPNCRKTYGLTVGFENGVYVQHQDSCANSNLKIYSCNGGIMTSTQEYCNQGCSQYSAQCLGQGGGAVGP